MSAIPSASLSDEEVVKTFPRREDGGVPGYLVDFLGTRTNTRYIAGLASLSGVVEGYPIPGNFHATLMEWAGALRAVLDAGTEMVVVELGAGWGPWLVSVATAARQRGVAAIRLVGVEGSKEHFAFLRAHLADNGFNPDEHTLLEGVVGPKDGTASFPIAPDPSADWGSAADFRPGATFAATARGFLGRLRGRARGAKPVEGNRFVKVKSFALATVLAPYPTVDLAHVDIQGAECEVLASAREELNRRVKRLVIGTHGRTIEERLFEQLARQSWVLEAEESCMYQQHGARMTLYRDGCQVWRNPRLFGG